MRKLILLVIFSLIFPVGVFAKEDSGVVTRVSGDVSVIKSGKEVPAEIGMIILKKDSIKTRSGQIDLSFNESAGVRLLDHSTLSVKKLKSKKTRVAIEEGNILVKFLNPSQDYKSKQFQVETPVVVASVRGTQFWGRVEPNQNNATSFAVLEGKVQLDVKRSSQLFILNANEAIDLVKGVKNPAIRPMKPEEASAISSVSDIRI